MKQGLFTLFFFFSTNQLFAKANNTKASFPPNLDSYQHNTDSIMQILAERIAYDPFNLVASLIFLCAIIHALMANKILKISHSVLATHNAKYKNKKAPISIRAELLHFFGEVEAIFGIWLLALAGSFLIFKDWNTFVYYIEQVNYTEPIFVVVIMAIAASGPIINFAENNLKTVANALGGSISAYWFCILTVPPLLGSFITEPAAMTIAALLLSHQFYEKKPSLIFSYATIGLLFVNISIGGTLTHFAAPPVLIVANTWDWGIVHMITNFGWKAILSILISNTIYFFIFRKELKKMSSELPQKVEKKIPPIITAIHILFIIWTVFTAHYIPLFVGGFLFFLAFVIITRDFQTKISLKSPLLVGFFFSRISNARRATRLVVRTYFDPIK